MKGFLRSAFFLCLVILLSFWIVKPLFQPGFFPMHDDTQPARVYEMAKALSYGQFPVRWVGDLGYGFGYPLFNFYSPLPYYIGAAFNLIGFDALAATKIMFLLGIILAGVTMFFFLDSLVGEIGALVGSLLYMYAPYHAVDIYVRGAVGEFYALAFLPLIFLGTYQVIAAKLSPNTHDKKLPSLVKNIKSDNESKKGILLGALGFAGVLLSHNILGMITAIIFIVSILVYLKSARFYFLLLIFILGLGIVSFFVLPAFLEKNFTRVNELTTGSSNFTNHFVYFDQLWSSPWGYAGSSPGRADGMSFMIGKIHILLGLLSIPVVFFFHKRKRINNFQFTIYISMLIVFLISVFLMLEQSKFIWNLLPGFAYIQYPWRFLVYTVFSLSIMIAMMFTIFSKSKQIILAIFLITATILFNSKYFVPKEYLSLQGEDYTSGLNLRFKVSKISDEYLPSDFLSPKSAQEISWKALRDSTNLKVLESGDTPIKKIYKVYLVNPALTQTNITYFPGWQAKIDSVYTNISSNNGRIQLFLPAGQHNLEFIFKDTPVRLLANTISILALFLVVYIILL